MSVLGLGIGIPFRRILNNTPALPTGLSASFTVDTISGDLTWTDNSGGTAQYEIYSSTNGGDYALLTTTSVGATSYSDTTCKQNASVVYRIRAKEGGTYSEFVTASTISTPLCLKTNQSTLNTVTINYLNISSGSITINWGDATTNTYTGNNLSITHLYSSIGQYNISFTGDTNNITNLTVRTQNWINGNITNWNLPSNLAYLALNGTAISGNISTYVLPISLSNLQLQFTSIGGDISNLIVPKSATIFYLYSAQFIGSAPNISNDNIILTGYDIRSNKLSGQNITNFSKTLTTLNLSGQLMQFPTSEIDKFFKSAADWYQLNPPTANCTYNLSGANMGIPTGGVTNVDIVRLIGYYSAAGFTATIICRTS